MLVFVSDLHLRDEEARTVSPRATHGFLTKSLVPLVGDAAPARLTIVFLGDLVDINRSRYWVDGRSEKKTARGKYTYGPWSHWRNALATAGRRIGSDPDFDAGEFERHVLNVMEEIMRGNRESFQLWKAFRNGDAAIWGDTPIPAGGVRYEFIPGNHDRLAQHSRATRALLSSQLGLDHRPELPFDWIKAYREHRVVAFHGHVLSPENFGAYDQQPTDPESSPWYDVPSVGDAITVTFGVGLVQEFLTNPITHTHPELADSLAQIDLVRPQSAGLRWLQQWGVANSNIPGLSDALDQIAAGLVERTLGIDFVRWWMTENLPWYLRLGVRLAMYLHLLQRLSRMLWLYERVGGGPATTEDYSNAMAESVITGRVGDWIKTRATDCNFVISGHTHKPIVRTISGRAGGGPLAEHVYFNSGTWLPLVEEGAAPAGGSPHGFAQRKEITHVTFYEPGDDVKNGGTQQSYWEFWHGSLREGREMAPPVRA